MNLLLCIAYGLAVGLLLGWAEAKLVTGSGVGPRSSSAPGFDLRRNRPATNRAPKG